MPVLKVSYCCPPPLKSVRRCCEQSLYTPLDQGEEARRQGGGGVERRRRRRREDIKKQEKTEAKSNHESSPSTSSQTLQASGMSKSKPSPEPPAFGGHPDPTVLGSALVKATVAVPRGSSDPVEALAGSAGEGKLTAVKQKGRGSVGQNSAEEDTSSRPQDRRENNNNNDGDQWVDVKQRQLEQKHTHAIGGVGGEGGKIKTSTPPPHPNPHKLTPTPDGHGADLAGQAPRVPGGKVRTPRTDEAVWAAGALGFLLVLLAVSVLHTRIYRQWRTTPSMYWHDPRRDYDRVAGSSGT